MLKKDQIEPKLIEYLSGRSEVLFAYLFGSAVDSEVFQDVDLGLYVGDMGVIDSGFDYAFRMSGELEDLLGCQVDVILMNTAPDHLIHSISTGNLVVNRDDDARVEFLTASWSRYFDMAVKRRLYLKAVALAGDEG